MLVSGRVIVLHLEFGSCIPFFSRFLDEADLNRDGLVTFQELLGTVDQSVGRKSLYRNQTKILRLPCWSFRFSHAFTRLQLAPRFLKSSFIFAERQS